LNKSDCKLRKVERLSSRTVIKDVFEHGEQLFLFPFKVFYRPNIYDYNRILISVPKKTHKKAITRNLLKRRIKEAYRQNPQKNGSNAKFDIIFIYISGTVSDFNQIQKKLNNVLGKIQENSTASDLAASSASD